MAAPRFITDLTAVTSLSSAAAVHIREGGLDYQTTPAAFINQAASFLQSGTGATPTTMQDEGRQWFRPEQFGATGGADDTTAFQNAINAANTAGGGWIRGFPGRTYIVSGLTPKANVFIDLNGATIFLKNNSNVPVFYDGRTDGAVFKWFGVYNGSINANKANNTSSNQSAGVFWLTNWDFLVFSNLRITNAFRNVFNLYGCQFEAEENIELVDCGQNTGGFFSYGGTYDQSVTPRICKYLHHRNFKVKDMWGFGKHYSKAEDFVCENHTFDTLTYTGTAAIAITCTTAKRGRIANINCISVGGDNIELNGNQDILVENGLIDTAGDIPLLFGTDASTNNNERVIVRNVKTTSTAGSVSARLNYTNEVLFEHCDFDKAYDLTVALPRENVRFIDCQWSVALFANAVQVNEIHHRNSRFTDWTIIEMDRNTLRAALASQALADTATLNVDMSLMDRAITTGTGNGGTIRTVSSFQSNYAQGSYQFAHFYHQATTLNISAITNAADGSTARQLTYAADAANQRIQLTNNTGVALFVAVVVDIVTGSP